MDINTLRGIMTGLLILVFIGIFLWAYSKNRKNDFYEASMLPFTDEEIEPSGTKKSTQKEHIEGNDHE